MSRCSCSGTCKCSLEAVDTACINTTITGAGTPTNKYLISSVPIVDPAAGNQLSCGVNGLLVPAAAVIIQGHVIKEEGTPLTQRAGLNFIGNEVVATDDAGGNETEIAINHLATAIHSVPQPLTVRKNTGADVGTRPRINLIEGANITLTVADDAGSNEVDVTIAAAGDAIDSITVRKNTGADVGTRPRLNLIEGANITLTVADDAGSNEVDVTIAASGGGGSAGSPASNAASLIYATTIFR